MPEILHPLAVHGPEGGGVVLFGYTVLGLLRVGRGLLCVATRRQYLPLTRNGTKRVDDRQRCTRLSLYCMGKRNMQRDLSSKNGNRVFDEPHRQSLQGP